MKATIYNTANTLTKANMKRFYNKYILLGTVLLASILCTVNTFAQAGDIWYEAKDYEPLNAGVTSFNNGTALATTTTAGTFRTGTTAIAFTAGSTSARHWMNNNIGVFPALATGYAHIIYYAKTASAATTSSTPDFEYNTSPTTGDGSSGTTTGGAVTLNESTWTRVTGYITVNNTGRYYYADPIYQTSSSGVICYFDDFIVYHSASTTTDITAPSAGASSLSYSGGTLSWTNGTDAGEGISGALILGTNTASPTSPVIETDVLHQGYYANSATITVGGTTWTVIGSTTGTSIATSGYTTYAVINFDKAYNYAPVTTLAVVACTSPTLTHNLTATSTTICDGSSTTIGLNSSESGVTYELLAGGSAIGGGVTAAGDAGGGAITFAAQSPSANTTYTVRSTTAGSYCQTAINGGTPSSQAITVNGLPAISAHPSATNRATCNSGTAFPALTVTASGAGLSYQWYSSTDAATGTSGDDLTVGTNSNSYTPVNTTTGVLYYYCVVSGTCAPAVTSTISGSHTVNSLPTSAVLAGTATICAGGSTNMTVTITGGATPFSVVHSGATVSSYTSGANISVSPGSTTTYTLTSVTDANGCVATTPSGSAAITVNPAVSISAQPNSPSVIISGSSQNISVTASNATGYQWQYCATSGGTYNNVADGTPTGITYGTPTAATMAITAGGTASPATGYYKCVVSGTAPCADVTSSYGTATIAAACSNPTINTQPSTGTQTLCVGATPTDLSVSVTGATGYQWYSSADAVVGSDNLLAGATSATYTPSTASASALYYYCIATSGACSTTSNFTGLITVNAAPAISVQPSNATAVISGAATSMSVTASNATGYQWQYCATSGGTYNNVADGTPTGITYTNATTATLGITAGGTASAGTGYYKCVVSGTAPCANTTSSYGTLTISASLPTSTSYASYVWKTNQSACPNAGSQASVVLAAALTPAITVSGTGYTESSGSSMSINAINEELIFTSTLDITSVCFLGKVQCPSIDYSVDGGATYQTLTSTDTSADALYTISSFAAGAKSFRFKYTEAGTSGLWLRNMTFSLSCTAPTVNSITASQTLCAGSSPALTVSATANSAGALTYQWYNGGGAIGSATSATYTASSIAATTTFYCKVTENSCAVNSNNSVVTVNAVPAISSQSTATATYAIGATPTNLSVTATGAATLTYQWYSNTTASNSGGSIIGGATSATYAPSTAGAGTTYYYCIVTSTTCNTPVTSSVSGAIIVANAVPTLTAAVGATVDANFNITYPTDDTWRDAITAVKIGGTALTLTTDYVITTSGVITLKPSGNALLQSAGTKAVTVEATGYTTASVSQAIGVGAANKLAITTQPTAPATNGGALGTTSVVKVHDQYGNIVTTSSASIVATATGGGTWTVGGTTTVSASSGSASFSTLTATSAGAVTGATVTYTSTGLTSIASSAFNIPVGIMSYNYTCEGFEDAAWTTVTTGAGYTGTITSTTGSWYVYKSKRNTTDKHAGANSINPSESSSYLQSPTLASGVGTITFWGLYNAKTILVQVYNSSNTKLAEQTFTMTGAWVQYSYSFNEATGTYVRFVRGSDNGVKIDDICISAYGVAPTVTTQAVGSVATTTATGNGTITNVGDGVTSSGVVWNTATTPTVALSTKTTDGPTTATTLTGSITSLTANTLYYVRAYATGAGGTGYGNEITFTTLPAAPSVATESSITSTSFVANWTAPTQGSATCTYTLEYGTDNTFATKTTVTGISATTYAVSGLSANTTYYYRVKANNTTGDGAYSATYETVTTSAPAAEILVTQAGVDYLDGTSTYAYGAVTNSTSADITFTVQNTGAGTLTISSSSVSGTGFTKQTSPSGTIAAGASSTFVVRFTPTSSIAFTGTITINSDDADEAVYTIALTGTGTSDLSAPTGLVSSSATASGFTLGYNIVGGASSGYETKACVIDATPTNNLELTNAEITAWTPFPAAVTCTDINAYSVNFNTNTTVAATEGTITLKNIAIGGNASCNYILLGKPNQTAQVAHPTITYWEGGNSDITGDAINDGGMIISPELSSAATVTVNAAAWSGTGAILIEKSVDGGTTFTSVGSATNVTTTAANITATVNEMNPVIIRIRNVASGTNYKWIKVNSFSVTNYMDCGAANTIASQATASYNFTGLTPNTLYYYTIRSNNAGSYSRWSTASVATTETTLPNPPTLNATTSITSTGMTLNWAAPVTAGTETYTYTIEYGTDAGYAGASSLTGISSATLTQALSGLTKNQLYYYRVRCENTSGASTWASSSATTLSAGPTVTTTTATSVATTTASTGGNITDDGGLSISDMGLAYGTSANPTTGLDEPSNTTGAYTSSLTSLTPNTKYYYRAYAVNGNGTSYGAESDFTTLPAAPVMTAGSSASMTGFTANWTAPASTGNQTYTYTIEVTTSAGVYTSPTATVSSIASGTLSYVFSTLPSNTPFYYRVKVVNSAGSSDWSSESVSISSLAGGAAVTTTAMSNISTTGADGGGDVTSDGGASVTARGIVYNTSANPTTANNPTSNGTGTGVFTSTAGSLTPNTKYYYRAYATNSNATSYGVESNFTTLPNAPTVGTGNAETGVGFTANWTAPTGQGSETFTYEVIVSATSGDYTSPAATYNNISSANLSQVITGLSSATNYYYKVRASNQEGAGAWSTQSLVVTTAATKTLTPTFTNGTVTVNSVAASTGVPTSYSANETLTLEATPATGYGFLRWKINGTQNVADNPYILTLSDNTTAQAVFGAAACATYNYDDVTNLSTSNVASGTFTTASTTWSVLNCRLNTSSSYSHSGNNSIRLSYSNGSLISPAKERPVSISFWAKMYNTSYSASMKVYLSTDGGTTYDATPLISQTVSGTAWVQYSANISTTSTNAKLKIVNASSSGGGTSYDLNIDDVIICQGPDAVTPSFTFDPTLASTGKLRTITPTVTATEKLYRYNTTTGALLELTAANMSGMHTDTLAQFISLTKVSDNSAVPFSATVNAGGTIITVTPSPILTYATEYKLSIMNLGDANSNIMATTQYTTFTVEPSPIATIAVKEMSPYASITDGSTKNLGTLISASSSTKSFKIYNTGNAALTVTRTMDDSTKFTVTTAPSASIAAGDSSLFVITFTPGTTGAFTDFITLNTNDASNPAFVINLQGAKAAFVLPYTYESGCVTPIISASEFKHDYTSTSDIPAEIKLKNDANIDSDHFFADYSVFHVEGNCMPAGSSALRVGQDNNGLKVHLTNGCGQVTVKWCANGYRKIKITDNLGNIYEQSPTYQVGGVCYTTTSVVNLASDIYLNIEFLGTDPSLLTTVYFLEITPFDVDLKSAAKNIIAFSTTNNAEVVRVYDDVVLVTVPTAENRAALATDLIKVSPFATISPAQGTTRDYSAGPVTYTVTAENGTTKTYKVYVDAETVYSDIYYADTVQVTTDMNNQDQILEVLEISNSSCNVPVSGTGGAYTLYFLDATDKPGTYLIGGLTSMCIGTQAIYTITNAPNANNPTYTWTKSGTGSAAFTVIGSNVGPTYTLQAPDTLSTTDLSLSITVDFGAGCTLVNGTATKTIDVTDQPPLPITGLTANCAASGILTVTANGSTDATTYNWDLNPINTPIIIQDANTIKLNVGQTGNTDISATVNTQNGCGVTVNPTSYNIAYAQEETTWTGAVSGDWTDDDNWTNRAPKSCTNVIIPDVNVAGTKYPRITAAAACNNITFEPGAAVLGLQNLTYDKAFVQVEMQRDKWYTMVSPLKDMKSGDFGFMGAPLTQMTMFDDFNPDNSAYTANNWTKPFTSQTVDLDTINGFAFRLSTKSLNYPSAASTSTDTKTLTFPRLNVDSSLVESFIPFNSLTGKPYYANAVALNKADSIAYRFAAENSSNVIGFPITKPLETGLNLIGNPMMTHLSFTNLKSHNADIDNTVKFWNGSNYTSLISNLSLWSNPTGGGYKIAPMQAFIVNSPAGGTLSFLASDFVEDTLKTSFLRSASAPKDLLYVTINNGVVSNSAAVALRSAGSNSLDATDAGKLFVASNDIAEVYTLSSSKPLDINVFDKVPFTTPLGVRSTKKGNLQLSFKQVESYTDIDVHLINTQTGEKINLKENPSYEFEATEVYNEGKLYLEFRKASIVTEENITTDQNLQIIVKDNNTIKVISSPNNLIKAVTVLDEIGRIIVIAKDINQAMHEIVMNEGANVYIVKVLTEAENKTQKVILK